MKKSCFNLFKLSIFMNTLWTYIIPFPSTIYFELVLSVSQSNKQIGTNQSHWIQSRKKYESRNQTRLMPILNDLSWHDKALITCGTFQKKRIGLGTYSLLYGLMYIEPNSECCGLICSSLETKCT